jgi:hypothetical protein
VVLQELGSVAVVGKKMDGDNAPAAPQVKGAVLSNGGATKKKLQQQQSTQVVGPWVSKVRPSAAPAAQLQYAAMKMLLKLDDVVDSRITDDFPQQQQQQQAPPDSSFPDSCSCDSCCSCRCRPPEVSPPLSGVCARLVPSSLLFFSSEL